MRTNVEKVAEIKNISPEEAIARGRDTVADALAYLTSNKVQNFYARVINLMDRYSIPGMGTMGVTVQRGKYIFIYDPLFAASVSYEEICATCEHEVLHLVLEHIPRMITQRALLVHSEELALFDMTSNLAVDLAVNEFLADTWPGVKDQEEKPLGVWIVPENWKPALPSRMAYEDYHHLLMLLMRPQAEAMQKISNLAAKLLQEQTESIRKALNGDKGEGEGEGEGSGTGQGGTAPELQEEINGLSPEEKKQLEMLTQAMQSHTGWTHGADNAADASQAAEHGKELLKSALTSANKSRGTVPGHMRELIRKLLTPPTVPWTQFLHDIVQRTRQTKRVRGMARPSKKLSALKTYARMQAEEGDERFQRYAHFQRTPVFPGIKQDNKFTVVYALDTSGSMGTTECALGLSEIQHLQRADADINICVLYADTTINKEYWVGNSDTLDDELMGRGGTDFEPIFEYISEHMLASADKAPDILIYCTDGYAPPPTTRIPIPTVWLLTPRGMPVVEESGHITIEMRDYQLQDSYE